MPAQIVVPIGFFIMITAIVGMNLLVRVAMKNRELSVLARLKEKMLDRGMSAEEIERVLAAGTDKALPLNNHTTAPAKPHPGPMNWPAHARN